MAVYTVTYWNNDTPNDRESVDVTVNEGEFIPTVINNFLEDLLSDLPDSWTTTLKE